MRMATQEIPTSNNQIPVHISTQPQPLVPVSQSQRGFDKFSYQVGVFLTEYWATIITVALGLLVLTAIAIPFLSYFGLDSIAKPLFYSLHYVCAQVPSHSFYIFGHQLGLCERNFSIYTSMFLGSLVFVLSKKRLPGLPWWVWVLMLLPIAWDGITQMFGWRESTWTLRVITGILFGLGNVWFALPLMQKSLLETPPSAYYPPLPRPSHASLRPTRKLPAQDTTQGS
jgi:uncharacterized membrane protein